jgi:hypothetical protein
MSSKSNLDDEGIGGSGQTGSNRRWEQVADRVDGKQEVEGNTAVTGEGPASGQSLGGSKRPGDSHDDRD